MLIWRHSICSLILLDWLCPKASDHPLRSGGGSCSNIRDVGAYRSKKIYVIMSLRKDKTAAVVGSGGTPRGFLSDGARELSKSSWKAPSVQLLPALRWLGTRITLMSDNAEAPIRCKPGENRMRNIHKEMWQPVNAFYVSPIFMFGVDAKARSMQACDRQAPLYLARYAGYRSLLGGVPTAVHTTAFQP